MVHLHVSTMLNIVWNGSFRQYDTLKSQAATGDLIYFSVLLGDIVVWLSSFGWKVSAARLRRRWWASALQGRQNCMGKLRAGSCDSRTSAWDPSWIQHFSRRENFHFVFPVPTLLWGKGQIYIMKRKSGPGRGEMDLFNPGGQQTLEIWLKTQMLPWE